VPLYDLHHEVLVRRRLRKRRLLRFFIRLVHVRAGHVVPSAGDDGVRPLRHVELTQEVGQRTASLVKPPSRDTRTLSPAGVFGGKAPLRLAAQKSRPHAPSAPMRSAPPYFLCKWGA
jgi:hypothetical protein